MKTWRQIFRRVDENPQHSFALATLVETKGSTYRKRGARCLIDSSGETIGVLSGGCLEDEIAHHGSRVITDGVPVSLSFDTRLMYGCDGRLKILIERIPAAGEKGNLITQIGQMVGQREICRIRTCFEGSKLGSELLPTEVLVAEEAGVLIDMIPPPIRLLLFGTGPEIKPLAEVADTLGWISEYFGHSSELSDDFRADAQTAALVMNHNFGRDLISLDRLLRMPLKYIGLLGPKKRYAELLTRLSEHSGFDLRPKNLFSPAGLDIGSEAPEEIALSILAEVAAVLANRHGEFLRDRKLDIHGAYVVVAGGEAA